jgi:hypothetical protein
MRFLITVAFMLIAASGVTAQDGIYCSISGGQMVLDVEGINKTLGPYELSNPLMTKFTPAILNFSGEIHFIMGKRFVLGGKGFLFSQEQHAPQGLNREMKILGNMMVGNLGYTILDGKDNGFRLFPQIGVGVAKTVFQVKDTFSVNNDDALNTLLFGFVSDNLAEINKKGLVVDACVAMDWDWSFFPSMKCMSGIGCMPLLHAEFGFTFVPKKLAWMRDSNELTATEPEINLGGFYYGFGIGFGFTGAKE